MKDELDVTVVAKALEASFRHKLTPFDAQADIHLSREEAVLTLGMLSALVGILENEEYSGS